MNLIPSENLMAPSGVDSPVAMTEASDSDGYASFIGRFGFGNCFEPINHSQLGELRAFLVLQAEIEIQASGYKHVFSDISSFKREPMLFDYIGEEAKYTSLYLENIDEVSLFAYLEKI